MHTHPAAHPAPSARGRFILSYLFPGEVGQQNSHVSCSGPRAPRSSHSSSAVLSGKSLPQLALTPFLGGHCRFPSVPGPLHLHLWHVGAELGCSACPKAPWARLGVTRAFYSPSLGTVNAGPCLENTSRSPNPTGAQKPWEGQSLSVTTGLCEAPAHPAPCFPGTPD